MVGQKEDTEDERHERRELPNGRLLCEDDPCYEKRKERNDTLECERLWDGDAVYPFYPKYL